VNQHRATSKFGVRVERCGDQRTVGTDQMVCHQVCGVLEPEERKTREDAPLIGDRIGKNHVESADPVTGYQEQGIV
jgi:hypothetical protein